MPFRKGGRMSGPAASQMPDFDPVPVALQVFRDEAAVAVRRLVLAAEQACPLKFGWIQGFRRPALIQQGEELLLAGGPVPAGFPEGGEDLLGRSQQRQVEVLDAGHGLAEEA